MLLSLVFAYGWTLCFAGLAVAAFIALPVPFRSPVVCLFLCITVADVGYTAGLSKGITEAKAASAAYQAKLDAKDLSIRSDMDALTASLEAAQAAKSDSDSKAALYEQKLRESRACPLSDGDRKRLLNIR